MMLGLGFAIQTYHEPNPSVTPLYATTPLSFTSRYQLKLRQGISLLGSKLHYGAKRHQDFDFAVRSEPLPSDMPAVGLQFDP
jgi:hypothetical protein